MESIMQRSGVKIKYICEVCKKDFFRFKCQGANRFCSISCYHSLTTRNLSSETKNKMRMAKLGKKQSPEQIAKRTGYNKGKKMPPFSAETREKMRQAKLGRKASIETRRKQSESHKGCKAPNWQGGISEKHKIIRGSLEYRLWREAVFKRDNYTCIWCGNKQGGNLNADHIKPFAFYPELRFAIDNGRTLCIDCHEKTDTFGNRTCNIKKYEI